MAIEAAEAASDPALRCNRLQGIEQVRHNQLVLTPQYRIQFKRLLKKLKIYL